MPFLWTWAAHGPIGLQAKSKNLPFGIALGARVIAALSVENLVTKSGTAPSPSRLQWLPFQMPTVAVWLQVRREKFCYNGCRQPVCSGPWGLSPQACPVIIAALIAGLECFKAAENCRHFLLTLDWSLQQIALFASHRLLQKERRSS